MSTTKGFCLNLISLSLVFIGCGQSGDRTSDEGRVYQPPKGHTVATVVGIVVDSLGYRVEGANVSVEAFIVPQGASFRIGEPCPGHRSTVANAVTDASGEFYVVLKSIVQGPECGRIIAEAEEARSDTTSGIEIRYRDPLRVILK